MNTKKPEKDRKTKFLTIAVTDEDKKRIEAKARYCNLSLSAYARIKLLADEREEKV